MKPRSSEPEGPKAACGGRSSGKPGGHGRTVHGSDCQRDNLKEALARVKRNKGAPGIDGMTVKDLGDI